MTRFQALLRDRDSAFFSLQKQGKKTCGDMADQEHLVITTNILRWFPETEPYYKEVRQKCHDFGKPLRFELNMDNLLYTREWDHDIVITLSPRMDKEAVEYVVLHELGEADYLVSGMPRFHDKRDRRERFRLMEVLSHRYIEAKLSSKDLSSPEVIKAKAERWLTSLLEGHEQGHYGVLYEWQRLLCCIWAISTYGEHLEEPLSSLFDPNELNKLGLMVRAIKAVHANISPDEMLQIANKILTTLEQAGLCGISVHLP